MAATSQRAGRSGGESVIKRAKCRFVRLLAAFAAVLAGAVALFSQSGSCTDYVTMTGECSAAPPPSAIIAAVLLWGLALWLLGVWWKEGRRA